MILFFKIEESIQDCDLSKNVCSKYNSSIVIFNNISTQNCTRVSTQLRKNKQKCETKQKFKKFKLTINYANSQERRNNYQSKILFEKTIVEQRHVLKRQIRSIEISTFKQKMKFKEDCRDTSIIEKWDWFDKIIFSIYVISRLSSDWVNLFTTILRIVRIKYEFQLFSTFENFVEIMIMNRLLKEKEHMS